MKAHQIVCKVSSFLCVFATIQSLNTKDASAQILSQSSINQASCNSTGGRALTKNDIELRGRALGFSLDSNTMGRAFQNFALDSIGDVENKVYLYSRVREVVTQGLHRFVVPDGLGPIIINVRNSQGRIISTTYYSMSALEEVKFTRSVIYASSFEHQIIGHIDVASKSSAGSTPMTLGTTRPTPRLTLHTPADARIASSVIDAANRSRVAIWQQIACDVPATPSSTDMIMGKSVLLNRSVYNGSAPPASVPPSKIAGLRP